MATYHPHCGLSVAYSFSTLTFSTMLCFCKWLKSVTVLFLRTIPLSSSSQLTIRVIFVVGVNNVSTLTAVSAAADAVAITGWARSHWKPMESSREVGKKEGDDKGSMTGDVSILAEEEDVLSGELLVVSMMMRLY